jgi:hypothetical protein
MKRQIKSLSGLIGVDIQPHQQGADATQHQVCGPPSQKISSFLRSVKDDLGLKTLGVYRITYECGQVYIEQTGRSIVTSDISV